MPPFAATAMRPCREIIFVSSSLVMKTAMSSLSQICSDDLVLLLRQQVNWDMKIFRTAEVRVIAHHDTERTMTHLAFANLHI